MVLMMLKEVWVIKRYAHMTSKHRNVKELLISNMHNKLEEDTCENVEVIAPTRSNY